MQTLAKFISDNELWLMERILSYAKAQKYTDYTSTLIEAWRISIQGLSEAIIIALNEYGDDLPQFSADENYAEDPAAVFGVIEARVHRERGISLQMFLGLYKYYRYAYVDLVRNMDTDQERKLHYEKFVERVLDRIEIAFCSEWSGLDPDNTIKELQKSNRQITNEKNKYLTIFESLNVPTILIDEHGNIDNMNPKSFSMLGITNLPGAVYYGQKGKDPEEIKGTPLSETFPWLADEIKNFISEGRPSLTIDKEVREDDDIFYYSVVMSKMLDISGKSQGGIVLIDDLTQKTEMERQLWQSHKLQGIGQLASGVSHEINTPLQFLSQNLNFLNQSFSELFEFINKLTEHLPKNISDNKYDSNVISPKDIENVDYLREEVFLAIHESQEGIEHVSTIVKALNSFTHLDYESAILLDLNEVALNVLTVSTNEWKPVAEVKTAFSHNLAKITARPGEISQAILNLIINAADSIRKKYAGSAKQGLITIGTRNVEEQVEFYINDTGIGIPNENMHHIYDLFFTTKDLGESVGEGLTRTHTIIRNLNGTITCKSVEGKGTTFLIRLPASDMD
ncbi:PAS domain-containing sensor histidine kinase [Desulfovibrio gilichinskyi]|uniref:histidine kinase n=1 Tax=Desulfovibrio gilichinskyi TaxID=1519643 RepID=A0A1X7E559_9BACT|nr:ATP-binding protein [Desulfovibrio gilichinskyi]SMF27708.1 Signal transduction histidine kinase [Desulfovibrio gilichinskyi]